MTAAAGAGAVVVTGIKWISLIKTHNSPYILLCDFPRNRRPLDGLAVIIFNEK